MTLWSQLTVSGRLPPLHDTAAVAVDSEIYVIGGQNPRGLFSDLYILNTSMTLTSHNCPEFWKIRDIPMHCSLEPSPRLLQLVTDFEPSQSEDTSIQRPLLARIFMSLEATMASPM